MLLTNLSIWLHACYHTAAVHCCNNNYLLLKIYLTPHYLLKPWPKEVLVSFVQKEREIFNLHNYAEKLSSQLRADGMVNLSEH
jgi:hypothetical protein